MLAPNSCDQLDLQVRAYEGEDNFPVECKCHATATLGASVWENWAAVLSIHRTLCRRVGAIQARFIRPK